MANKSIVVLLSCLAIILAGCAGRSRSVVGTWDITGGPSVATMTFQSDGSFKTEATMRGRHSTMTGQYEQQGEKVTFKTRTPRTATIRWNSDDEMVMTGDDGVAMTLKRRK